MNSQNNYSFLYFYFNIRLAEFSYYNLYKPYSYNKTKGFANDFLSSSIKVIYSQAIKSNNSIMSSQTNYANDLLRLFSLWCCYDGCRPICIDTIHIASYMHGMYIMMFHALEIKSITILI